MAKKCVLFPTIRNANGEEVESRLFKDLLIYSNNNRQQAVQVYTTTKNAEFQRDWNPKLILDENGEPTLASLLEQTNLTQRLGQETIIKNIEKQVGAVKRDGVFKQYLNYEDAFNRVLQFNTTHPLSNQYVANTVKGTSNSDSNYTFWGIQVRPRNQYTSLQAEQESYNAKLNDRLRDILSSQGVAIGALTQLEERRGINGIADFDTARDAATGMVELIRLAEGQRGERALPEEFAHFAIEALGDNPLVNRLVNNIADNNLAPSIIGENYASYEANYNGDTYRLAKEAAGKLVARSLNNEYTDTKSQSTGNLLTRVIQAIKNFFGKFSASSIQNALMEADNTSGNLAREILNGQMDSEYNLRDISGSEQYFNLTERLDGKTNSLQEIINNELKRLSIYDSRSRNKEKFTERQQLLLDKLELALEENSVADGISTFLKDSLDILGSLDGRLKTIQETPGATMKEKASALRDIKNYMYSYSKIYDTIREELNTDEDLQAVEQRYNLKGDLNNASNLLNDLYSNYKRFAMPLFVDFMKPFISEDALTVPFGKFEGKTMTVEDLFSKADRDISFWNRWIDSMSNATNYTLRLFDAAVKKSKEQARLTTIDEMKHILALGKKLEESGIKDTEFMFEKDADGNLTGNYISPINYATFAENRNEFEVGLTKRFTEEEISSNISEVRQARYQWLEENGTRDEEGTFTPDISKYGSDQFRKLTPVQREYYDAIMAFKAQKDSLLPDGYTTNNKAVQIRRDLVERIKAASSPQEALETIGRNIKDSFVKRVDDTDFGDVSTQVDYEGNEVQMLPIYYTHKLENLKDLSTDVTSTMVAYAAMANDFNEMNKVIDTLELGRDLMKEMQIRSTKGGRPQTERFNILGRTIENPFNKNTRNSNILNRLNDYFSMQVYNKYVRDEGTLWGTNIQIAKVADNLNFLTSLNTMALNSLLAVSNVETGKAMARIEAIAGEFFTTRDLIQADKIYARALPAFLAQIGDRIRTNKLHLFMEKFNVLQEFEQDVKEVNFDRKTWFSRMFSTSTLFFGSNAGEHWMQTRTMLALANGFKMKTPNGKLVNLWDALEVVPLDKSNKKLGSKLEVKEGYVKEDGTQLTQDEIIALGRKAVALNQRMHGIYNKLDRAAAQSTSIGRLGFMFRKWIPPSIVRRFEKPNYNVELNAWAEGYYNTMGKFALNMVKELRTTGLQVGAHWDKLTNHEKANIKRAFTEVAHLALVALLMNVIDGWGDKDNPWAKRMAAYQSRRLFNEIGVFVPGPWQIQEAWTILKSPAASINTAENIADLYKLVFSPQEWFELTQSGRYQGQPKNLKRLLNSPLVPLNRTIYKNIQPEESIAFYKQ